MVKKYLRNIAGCLFLLTAVNALAQSFALQTASLNQQQVPTLFPNTAVSPAFQDLDELAGIAKQFLTEKTQHLKGDVLIDITPLDNRLMLSACKKPIPYLSQGAKVWGKTTVAIRCENPKPWRIMVKAQVKIHTDYLTAAKALPKGHVISESDLTLEKGDITAMRSGVLTDKKQAVGFTVSRTIQPGSAIWAEQLQTAHAIRQGQQVKVITQGKGFSVSSEGKAINNAGLGQLAKAKMPNGTIVRGIAKTNGIIEVPF